MISHGPNKKGAFGVNSSLQNAVPSDTDEVSNYVAVGATPNFDNSFVSLSENSDVFDDIVFYINPRMLVAQFNLYRLLPCNRIIYSATNYGTGPVVSPLSLTSATSPNTMLDPNYPNTDIGGNAWFGQSIKGGVTNACPGSDFEKNHSKKCGPVGQWIVESSCALP